MKKIRVGILGVAAAAALCFTAGAVYLYARGVWQMPIPADRALPVLMYHHIVEDGEPCNDYAEEIVIPKSLHRVL